MTPNDERGVFGDNVEEVLCEWLTPTEGFAE